MAEIIELTGRDNNLYLQLRIHHPDHGSEARTALAALRQARHAMEHGLPQVGPGYMCSVAGQNMYLGVDGPILNVGIYDARDVETAFLRLVESLESAGWSGAIALVDHATVANATYQPEDLANPPLRPMTEASFSAPRPPVATPVPGRVVVDEPRISHSWQEGMDRNYGWLRFECAADRRTDAAVTMANGLAEAIHRTGANTTRPGDDDYLSLGPVMLSTAGPFVALDDVGDFPMLRRIIGELTAYLEDGQIEGVLTILDFREGSP